MSQFVKPRFLKTLFFITGWMYLSPVYADGLVDSFVQARAYAFLTVMSYSLTPDVTTGSLSISDKGVGNPSLQMTSLGGGDVLSKDIPLYLEGTIAASRYDPTFITSSNTPVSIPVHWNSISGTGGVGWDFQLSEHYKLRPIFNFSLGHEESDISLASRYIYNKTGLSLDFLNNGRLNAYGLGGSLMFIYEDFTPEREDQYEIRYTNIQLKSFDSSHEVEGSSNSQSLGLWARRRVPTGLTIFDNMIRGVFEFAHTQYLGDNRGALGFDYLSSIGSGFELDLKNYDVFVSRARLLLRYQFAPGVSGYSIGMAVSF